MAAEYTRAVFERQIQTWRAAARAYRQKDGACVADLLLGPRDTPARECAGMVTLTILGVGLCAEELARINGHGGARPPAGHRYVLEALDPSREAPASTRLAFAAVTGAANGEIERVAEQVEAYARPDPAGLDRIVDLQLDLLGLYVALADAGSQR